MSEACLELDLSPPGRRLVVRVTLADREDLSWLLEQLGLDLAVEPDEDLEDEGQEELIEVDEGLEAAIVAAIEAGNHRWEDIARAAGVRQHTTKDALATLRKLGRVVYIYPHKRPPTWSGGSRGGGWHLPTEDP